MPYPGRKYYRFIIIMKTLETFQFVHITWTHHTFNFLLSSYLMTIMQYEQYTCRVFDKKLYNKIYKQPMYLSQICSYKNFL